MVEITGGREDRAWAAEVADWCARELEEARLRSGTLETRPFVQNADLIIAALREYAQRPLGIASVGPSNWGMVEWRFQFHTVLIEAKALGIASVGPSFRDMTKDLPRNEAKAVNG